MTSMVNPFGMATTIGGYFTVDPVLFEFEDLDQIAGDSGEPLAPTGPDARVGLEVDSSAGNGIHFVSANGGPPLDHQLPSGAQVSEVGITAVATEVAGAVPAVPPGWSPVCVGGLPLGGTLALSSRSGPPAPDTVRDTRRLTFV